MKCEIQEFIEHLHNTRGTSRNTEVSYERDLKKLEQFLKQEGILEWHQVSAVLLNSYIMYLERKRYADFHQVRTGFFHIQKRCIHKSFFSVFMSERVLERKSCGRFKSTKDRKKGSGNINCK